MQKKIKQEKQNRSSCSFFSSTARKKRSQRSWTTPFHRILQSGAKGRTIALFRNQSSVGTLKKKSFASCLFSMSLFSEKKRYPFFFMQEREEKKLVKKQKLLFYQLFLRKIVIPEGKSIKERRNAAFFFFRESAFFF